MADKVYFWLKLKKDFFKRHDVRIIESMKYGKEMVLFYVKLLCESIDHEGRLRFSDEIPYTVPMLASITDTDETIVGVAVNLFQQLGLLEILDDGTYVMTKAKDMVGSETGWAEKKRRQKELPRLENGCVRVNAEMLRLPNGKIQYVDEKRYGGNGMLAIDLANARCEFCGSDEKILIHHDNGYSNDINDLFVLCETCHGKRHSGKITSLLHNRGGKIPEGGGNFPVGGGNFPAEIEKEIEIDLKDKKEKEKRKNPSPYQEIADLYNETCVSFPRLTSLSDARKKAINARLNSYGMEDFKRLFEKAEASAFLKGKNDRNWMANFDWLIKDANMAKVLDGNYDNKAGSGSGRPLDGMAEEIEKRMEQMQLGRR